ncbi:Fanconi-associated nuclease [Dirofilaria immitis]
MQYGIYLILLAIIFSTIIIVESFALLKHYKQLLSMQNESLHSNSNISYNIIIETFYPYHNKDCNRFYTAIFNRQTKHTLKFQLNQNDQTWRIIFHNQNKTRSIIIRDHRYKHQFRWSFCIGNWKVAIKWNNAKIIFRKIHESEKSVAKINDQSMRSVENINASIKENETITDYYLFNTGTKCNISNCH